MLSECLLNELSHSFIPKNKDNKEAGCSEL